MTWKRFSVIACQDYATKRTMAAWRQYRRAPNQKAVVIAAGEGNNMVVAWVYYSSNCFCWEVEFSMMLGEILKTHREFLDRILVPIEQYNPLPILMRAVNGLHLPIQIKQPCWRTNRWKSLT